MNRSKTPATPLSLEFVAWTCVIQPIFSDFSQNIFLVSFAAVIRVVTQRFSQKRCVTTLKTVINIYHSRLQKIQQGSRNRSSEANFNQEVSSSGFIRISILQENIYAMRTIALSAGELDTICKKN